MKTPIKGRTIEQKIKNRIRYCVGLLILGAVSVALGTCANFQTGNAEYSSGFYTGVGFALVASAIITIIKCVRLLKNEAALREREVYEFDERNIMIGLKTFMKL